VQPGEIHLTPPPHKKKEHIQDTHTLIPQDVSLEMIDFLKQATLLKMVDFYFPMTDPWDERYICLLCSTNKNSTTFMDR